MLFQGNFIFQLAQSKFLSEVGSSLRRRMIFAARFLGIAVMLSRGWLDNRVLARSLDRDELQT